MKILGLLFLAMLHSGMALADVGADLQLAPVPRSAVLKERIGNVHIPLITYKPLAQAESSDIQIIPKPQEIQR